MRGSPLVTVLLLGVLAGCPAPEPEPEPTPEPVFLGADPAARAAPGEARAGVVREGELGEAALFGGIAAEGRAGDVKIYNDRVQFLIQGPYESHGYMGAGGNVIDVDLVRPEGVLGRDSVDDLFLAFGIGRVFEATSVEVIHDGSDGGPALVRATGFDADWKFVMGATESPDPLLPDQSLEIVTDYELEPGATSLTVTSTLTNVGDEPNHFNPADGFMGSGEDFLPWTGGFGQYLPDSDELPAMGSVGRSGEGVLTLWPDEGTLKPLAIASLLSSVGMSLTSHGWTDLQPGESSTLRRHWGFAPDSLTAEAERRLAQGEDMGAVSGHVTDPDGPVAGARVHFVRGDLVGGYAITDADGSFAGQLPPGDWQAWVVARGRGEHVELNPSAGRYGPFTAPSINQRQLDALAAGGATPLPFARGRATPAPQDITVTAGAEAPPLELTLDAPGRLALQVQDDSGAPLPAVVEILPHGEVPDDGVPPELRDAFGLRGNGSRFGWAWTADGSVDMELLPGTYDLVVAHSARHERDLVTVEVQAGQTASATATLDEVVPRDGWFSVDSHLHAAPSSDGGLAMEDRLIACAATGVDIPVNTDHDRQADYRPIATALGLDERMEVIPGVEVSPVIRGHYNLFPIDPRPRDRINGGAPPWWEPLADTEELFARMRDSAPDGALIQVNHGRSSGMGMMDLSNYHPENGSYREDFWSWGFDLVEIVNGHSANAWVEPRADWFSWLNQGYRRVPTGVSDSHYRTSPCGYGRTDLYLGVDSIDEVTPQTVRDALVAGPTVVAGGLTLRATLAAGGAEVLPSGELSGTQGELHIRLLAPTWIHPDTLRVVRNGETVVERSLPDEPDGATWFDEAVPVEAAQDSWFVVEATGSEPLGQTWGGALPYAITNAFFLDTAGDGWEPPGLGE